MAGEPQTKQENSMDPSAAADPSAVSACSVSNIAGPGYFGCGAGCSGVWFGAMPVVLGLLEVVSAGGL